MKTYYVFIQTGEPAKQKPIERPLRLSRFSDWKYPYCAIASESDTCMAELSKLARLDGLKGYIFAIDQARLHEVAGFAGAALDIPTMREHSDAFCNV